MLAEPSQMSTILQVGDSGVNAGIGEQYKKNYTQALLLNTNASKTPFSLRHRITCLVNAIKTSATPARITSSFERCGISCANDGSILNLEEFYKPETYRQGSSFREENCPKVTVEFLKALFSVRNLSQPWLSPAYLPSQTLSLRQKSMAEELRIVKGLLEDHTTPPGDSHIAYLISKAADKKIALRKYSYVLATLDTFLSQPAENDCHIYEEETVTVRSGRVTTAHGRLLTSENTMMELVEVEERSKERKKREEERISRKEERERKEQPLRDGLAKYTSMSREATIRLMITKAFLVEFVNAQNYSKEKMEKPKTNVKKDDLLERAVELIQLWENESVPEGSKPYQSHGVGSSHSTGLETSTFTFPSTSTSTLALTTTSTIASSQLSAATSVLLQSVQEKILTEIDLAPPPSTTPSVYEVIDLDNTFVPDGPKLLGIDSLDPSAHDIVEKMLLQEGLPFPVPCVPCGGHSLLHAIPVDAKLINNLIRKEWMVSDTIDLVAGAIAVTYSQGICILTSGPSHTVFKPVGNPSTVDLHERFTSDASREVDAIHHNAPLTSRPPHAVAMPVNTGTYHWVVVVAYPQRRHMELLDSQGYSESGMAVCKHWGSYLKSFCEKRKWLLTESRESSWRYTCRLVPEQTNGIDCGRFCMWNLLSLGEAFSLIPQADNNAAIRRVDISFKKASYIQSWKGRSALVELLLQHVANYLHTETWTEVTAARAENRTEEMLHAQSDC